MKVVFLPYFFKNSGTLLVRTLAFCLHIINDNLDLATINKTNIVLLPKVPHPTDMVNFRFISFYNVIYKIIANMLVNKLKDLMDACIDKSQSAFVPRRFISNNVLVAYEILHTLHQKHLGRRGFMAFKLDMSKAYD